MEAEDYQPWRPGREGSRASAPVSRQHDGRQLSQAHADLADVEVDRETGKVDILNYTTFQDVGLSVNPVQVEGQMQGGVVQGIGWALNEEYIYDDNGEMLNAGFLDYRIPVASDLPMIDTVIIECPNPGHPYGVRGCGEVPIVPPIAAVVARLATVEALTWATCTSTLSKMSIM